MHSSVHRISPLVQAALAAWLALSVLSALTAAEEAGERTLPQLIDPQGRTDEEQELLAGCEERIRQQRTAPLTVVVLDRQDDPVPDADVHVQQTRHAFLFGCNVYALDSFGDEGLNRRYAEQFAALLNYATLPFYWSAYEPQRGQTQEARLMKMAEWCAARGIATKGHPLVWHETVPGWLPPLDFARGESPRARGDPEPAEGPLDRDELLGLVEARVRGVVSGFVGSIDRWDVVNEATVSAGVDNPIGHWVKDVGSTAAVRQALEWAREAGPQAVLVVNDFNVWSDAYPQLLRELNAEGVSYDAIGLQSHMHAGTRPFTDWWQVCERYAALGKPLHFTEMTVLSGALQTDSDWRSHHLGWDTMPEGEELQAEYVANLYRLLFSHPAVQAITWWDFSDAAAWQGAPAGLVRKDMTPKPVYERLLQLIKDEWWTDETRRTDEDGRIALRGFCGDYRVIAQRGGRRAEVQATLRRDAPNEWRIRL